MPRPEIVTVVGGGWSAGEIDLTRLPGLVIGVNESAVLVRCDTGLSMDRLWTEARWDAMAASGITFHIRSLALKNKPERPDWMRVFDCDVAGITLSETQQVLNGANSGMCGLNLAYTMKPRRIVLVGFDMQPGPNGEPYWHAPYPWASKNGATKPGHFERWIRQFDHAARQCADAGIEVLNVSDRSLITAFTRVKPEAVYA